MRLRLGLLLALALALVPAGRAAALEPLTPAAVPLGEGWEYRADGADRGLHQGWPRTGGPLDGWAPVVVPHVFTPRTDARSYHGTLGWYRLRFTGPETIPGYGWDVEMEQVRLRARVWLNGREIGVSSNPYVPFRVPAQGLRPGEENVLLVRVSNVRPATLREGWWNHGGLTRRVRLVPRTPVALENQALVPDVRCTVKAVCTAGVVLDGRVVNRTPETIVPVVRVTLQSPSGKTQTAESQLAPLEPRTSRRERLRMAVPEPELWSPQTPQLYTATVVLGAGGPPIAATQSNLGLRSVTVRHGRLRLNGRVLRLRGAGITEDLPGEGAALDDAGIDRIVADLKGLNANVTRAHLLLDRRLLDRFDAEGIMVWSEAAVYHADEELRTARGRKRHLRTLRQTVLEARRHPSVITHAVADELGQEPDRMTGTGEYLRRAAAIVRDLDPSVPPSLDLLSYPNIPRQRAYLHYPLLGLNTYYGWYPGKAGVRGTAKLSGMRPYLEQMRRRYPGQALAVAEFGAEARFDGPRTQKGTYAFQADYVRRVLDIVDSTPYLAGAIYWTAREFPVKPDWTGGAPRANKVRSPMHAKGLIFYDGRPKPAWSVARERFGRITGLNNPVG